MADLSENLATIGVAMMDELVRRLDVELTRKDLTAVTTALMKASLRAAKVTVRAFEEQGVVIEQADLGPEELDLWAELYS